VRQRDITTIDGRIGESCTGTFFNHQHPQAGALQGTCETESGRAGPDYDNILFHALSLLLMPDCALSYKPIGPELIHIKRPRGEKP
jgi:hypothetical protein